MFNLNKQLTNCLLATLMALFSTLAWSENPARQGAITVYKSATCACCNGWVDHLRAEGFNVTTKNQDDMDKIKIFFGVRRELQSCHTAVVDGYVIEGHVPADDIKRLLQEQPALLGLSAPGMPMESPGMQRPGLSPKGYDIISFDGNGGTGVYNRY